MCYRDGSTIAIFRVTFEKPIGDGVSEVVVLAESAEALTEELLAWQEAGAQKVDFVVTSTCPMGVGGPVFQVFKASWDDDIHAFSSSDRHSILQ